MGLYLDLQRQLTSDEAASLGELARRRINREPSAYITGHTEFAGLDLATTPAALIPRPETELLVEKAVDLIRRMQQPLIADIGTGCGAIAIALALRLPRAVIYATDVSGPALELAALNCRRHCVADAITLLQGNLSEPLPEPVHLIVANLPYVRDPDVGVLATEISAFEPRIALNGGPDGLRLIEELLSEAHKRLMPTGGILLEIANDQAQAVCDLAGHYLPQATARVTQDLAGLDRLVAITHEG